MEGARLRPRHRHPKFNRGFSRCGETAAWTILFPQPAAERNSSAQFAQELPFIHPVLKSLAAVDEDHGDFVVIEPPDLGIRVDVDFTPGEAALFVELVEALLDDLAEMTSLAGINDDFTRLRH